MEIQEGALWNQLKCYTYLKKGISTGTTCSSGSTSLNICTVIETNPPDSTINTFSTFLICLKNGK